MGTVVLLGDSIFDNAAYTDGGPDVAAHLRRVLPEEWKVRLLAVDGSMIRDVCRQLGNVPEDATNLVVSVGGNDALAMKASLEGIGDNLDGAMGVLFDAIASFGRIYGAMLQEILRFGLPTAVCMIYNPRFPDPVLQRLALKVLPLLNDAILSVAERQGVPIIDLRRVCTSDEDYANPIEPSTVGGAKIARAIAEVLAHHDFDRGRTVVYG